MNYSILIELSRHTIAFSYSRDDGKNQFIPYGDELVKPLAIYSSGNELRIGRFAAAEARAGRVGAFDNIFDAIKKPASFTYRGTQYPLNKLLLFGIEQCLREFFDSILYGTEGQLEQNTAKVPICLLMSSELTDNEQAYAVKLLRDAGYSNTFSIDYNSMVLDHVRTSLANNIEKAIFVSNVGNDLYIQCVDAPKNQQPKRIFDLEVKDAGKDPQIDQVVKLIWQEILYDENSINIEFDECLPELQIHAQRFLDSGDLMCQNVVTLNGHSYEYYISKSSISNGIRGNDNSLGNLLLQLKSKNVEPTKSAVVLLKSAAKNAYVKQLFCGTFPSVVIFDEEKHQEMLNSILEFVKKSNYKFSQEGTGTKPSREAPPTISPVLKREVRTRIADVNAKIRTNDRKGAKRIADKLLSDLHEQNVHDWDVEINSLIANMPLSDYNDKVEEPINQTDEITDDRSSKKLVEDDVESPKVDPKKYQREVRITIAEIKGKIRNKDYGTANSLLSSLESKLHKDGVLDYDGQLEEVKRGIVITTSKPILNNTQVEAKAKPQSDKASNKTEGKTTKKLSPAEKLLTQGKFADAKRAFASDGDSKMAQVCSDFIKSKRVIEQYKMGLEAAKRNKNRTTIANALRDLEKYQKLYKQYNVEYNELEIIINNYKSI